ncbi:MAG TPA: tRNA 2-selenouridine(34) synthase MnmH [Hanamia sp.]|nr:tRNA 2-selenouridine(34) synthase MnmH [Hanamia sp.]
MPVEAVNIETFLNLSKDFPILDVRSPGEYLQAHIPGAFSIPLFTDEQRKIIGTAYKQESRQVAVNHGLNYFSERMKIISGEVADIIAGLKSKNVFSYSPLGAGGLLIHCWRGGMRSEAVAWLLSLYGYKIYLLKGGYKSFRRWALKQFEKQYSFKILGGYTGSGKTEVLNAMKNKGKTVIDLEALANHKGSAFGSLGRSAQPSQEMFENLLAIELWKANFKKEAGYNGNEQTNLNNEIWLEDESRHIGSVGFSQSFWKQMRNADLYFLDIPFEERLKFIVSQYSCFDKKLLVTAIMKIQKRLGGLETKNAINFLLENKVTECFSILLHYYDKMYINALNSREDIPSLLNKIPCKTVDIDNAKYFFELEFLKSDS